MLRSFPLERAQGQLPLRRATAYRQGLRRERSVERWQRSQCVSMSYSTKIDGDQKRVWDSNKNKQMNNLMNYLKPNPRSFILT